MSVKDHLCYLVHAGIIRNDTVIADPLFTVPINSDNQDRNLCFEVHGRSDTSFNLISDKCVSVNALYSAIGDLNIVSAVGVRAEGNDGVCRNIQVDLSGCTVSTGMGAMAELGASESFFMAGISARKTRTDRVRISVPNCEYVNLVLWVICEREPMDMIRFQIARGVNLASTSHGLLGKYSGRS